MSQSEQKFVHDKKLIARDSSVVDFGENATLPVPPVLNKEEEERLYRKIDMRLIPILALLYLLSFIDRGNIGNAKLQGLTKQLHLTGDEYNIALTMYFIVASRNHFLSTSTLMGIVKSYPQLIGVRVCLGVAEAGLFPGISYYLTLWYPRYKLQQRIGVFVGAASVAGAFSGLLAYAISFMNGAGGLEGWSWIFILEGILTVLAGILALIVMVDFPETAKYDNSSVGEEEHFEMRHLWLAVRDWQVWLQILIFMSMVTPLYGITLFLPSIINSFGYSIPISQLLTVPPYVVATIVLFVFAHFSDKLKMRSPFIFLGLTMCLIGFSINVSTAPHGVKYFGTYFVVAGSYAALPGIIAWLSNNLAGQYKRGVGMALQIGIGNFGGAIACNIYRARDAPRYIFGHCIELMFLCIGFICVPIAALSYARINRKRDALEKEHKERGEAAKYSPAELRKLGDRAPDFRYTL
ncbi:hypothetical protein H0H92_013014 [Tricholoma furcatifolium]|nr:hypothetical protein H0H92_013014 [Tricholoma furcatifolium]